MPFVFETADATNSAGLQISFGRDNRGEVWTDEVTVVAGADGYSCGGGWLGNQIVALYTITDTDGHLQVYCRRNPSPEDAAAWSDADEQVLAGVRGRVLGLAVNTMGVICALLLQQATSGPATTMKALVSRDQGGTWALESTIPQSPRAIVALAHLFIALQPGTTSVVHFVSQDGGGTWR